MSSSLSNEVKRSLRPVLILLQPLKTVIIYHKFLYTLIYKKKKITHKIFIQNIF